ncbi:MAG: HTTM domain-containing protein, partial [Planctomycetota bacterium]
EAGHLFSWHMKLRGKSSGVRMTAVFDDGTVAPVDLKAYITPFQAKRFCGDPAMLRQLAQWVKADRLVVREQTVRGPWGVPTVRRWAHRPDAIDPAHPLPAGVTTEALEAVARRPVAVRALVLCSYNRRKPQLLLDPSIDLAAAPLPTFGRPEWVLPLVERSRTFTEDGPWDADVRRWGALVETDPEVVRRQARELASN